MSVFLFFLSPKLRNSEKISVKVSKIIIFVKILQKITIFVKILQKICKNT